MSELVYRKPCEHGWIAAHSVVEGSVEAMRGWYGFCDGGVEQVLDPDKVLFRFHAFGDLTDFHVSDALEVLDGEER